MIALLIACGLVSSEPRATRTHTVYAPLVFHPSSPRPMRDTIGNARLVAIGWDPLLYREDGLLRSDVLDWTVGPEGTTLVLRASLGPGSWGVEPFSSADVCHSVSAPCSELDTLRALVKATPEALAGQPLYRGEDHVHEHTTGPWLLRAQPNRGAVVRRGVTRVVISRVGDMEVVLRDMERNNTSILDVVRPADLTRIRESLPAFDLEIAPVWSWLVVSGPEAERAALRERFPPSAMATACLGTSSGPHVIVDRSPGGQAVPDALILTVSDEASDRCQTLQTALPPGKVTLGDGDLELRLVTVMGADPAPPPGDVWVGVRHIHAFAPDFPSEIRERLRRAVLTPRASQVPKTRAEHAPIGQEASGG